MGCFLGRLSLLNWTGSNDGQTRPTVTNDKTYSWDKRDKVDPSLYMIEKRSNEEIARLPGSINGQQFIIRNCNSSRIFLFDHVNTITIDDCDNCSFFIGPTAGSFFLRDCKNCSIVVACGQFRTRDCQKNDVFLHCQTQPIIEASIKIQFSCFQANYAGLDEQFLKAGLNIFTNNWSDIHDFTPVVGEKNYTLLHGRDLVHEQFRLPETSQVGLSLKSNESIVPLTRGSPDYSFESCLAFFFFNDSYHENAVNFMARMAENQINVQYTCELKVDPGEAQRIFSSPRYKDLLASGPMVAVLFTGRDVSNTSKEIALEMNGERHPPIIYTTDSSDEGQKQMEIFFTRSSMSMSF